MLAGAPAWSDGLSPGLNLATLVTAEDAAGLLGAPVSAARALNPFEQIPGATGNPLTRNAVLVACRWTGAASRPAPGRRIRLRHRLVITGYEEALFPRSESEAANGLLGRRRISSLGCLGVPHVHHSRLLGTPWHTGSDATSTFPRADGPVLPVRLASTLLERHRLFVSCLLRRVAALIMRCQ